MRNFTFVILFLGTVLGSYSQKAPSNVPLTTLKFDTTTVDYGVIAQGTDGTKVIKFKNTGSEVLHIYNVFSTVNCKIVSKPEKGIAPGGEGEIRIVYDTKVKGKIVRTLTVKANVQEGIIALNLIGLVE